jgi:hypothetical protein
VSTAGAAAQTGQEDGQVVECILLECSDGFTEQTGADEQDEVGYYDEENRKCCAVPGDQRCVVLGPTLVLTRTTGKCVDHEATDEAAYNAGDGSNWDGPCRLTEGNASNENDSFQALTQHNDERKCEKCPLSRTNASGNIYQHCINTRTRSKFGSYVDPQKRPEA